MMEQPLLSHVHAKADIFETAYFFYPDSSGRARLTPLESSFKTSGFGEQTHWFRVDGRSIRVLKYAVPKISGFL